MNADGLSVQIDGNNVGCERFIKNITFHVKSKHAVTCLESRPHFPSVNPMLLRF